MRERLIRSLSAAETIDLLHAWRGFWARPEQLAPSGDEWSLWFILAGRGWGKTRTGAEWCNEEVWHHGARRIALVARTAADCRDVMVDGESGILACSHPARRPHYEPSKRRVTWPNGAIATMYSAEEPDALRGPQHDLAWADELAAWQYDVPTWDNLEFGLRLGARPRALVTTTPRPTPLVRRLIVAEGTKTVRGSTYDNRANLPAAFLARIREKYEGTRLGRQELYAEVLDDNPNALWKRERIDELRVRTHPPLKRIIVGVDPAVSANANSCETGIVVAGLGNDNHGYVLADCSLSDTPAKWGAAVVTAYALHQANLVVGEVNNGGDLVEANVQTAARDAKPKAVVLPFKSVRASRGKQTRAEPIAALYEQGRIHHVGAFPKLEDELCDWDPAGNSPSPDRLDALVWALTELMLDEQPAQIVAPKRPAQPYRFAGAGRGF